MKQKLARLKALSQKAVHAKQSGLAMDADIEEIQDVLEAVQPLLEQVEDKLDDVSDEVDGDDDIGEDDDDIRTLDEMPAMKAANWAGRAISALLASGIDIPEEATNTGMAGVAGYGMGALTGQGSLKLDIDYDTRIQPLMDDLMDCVKIKEPAMVRKLYWNDDSADIEEAATIFQLQKAVLELHLGFSFAAKLSNLTPMAANPAQAFGA